MKPEHRQLGQRQRSVLRCLWSMGPYPGSGWNYGPRSMTLPILEGLVSRGLVEKVRAGMAADDPLRRPGLAQPLPHDRYQLSEAGRELCQEYYPKP